MALGRNGYVRTRSRQPSQEAAIAALPESLCAAHIAPMPGAWVSVSMTVQPGPAGARRHRAGYFVTQASQARASRFYARLRAYVQFFPTHDEVSAVSRRC
jgi:hypothetical protein